MEESKIRNLRSLSEYSFGTFLLSNLLGKRATQEVRRDCVRDEEQRPQDISFYIQSQWKDPSQKDAFLSK